MLLAATLGAGCGRAADHAAPAAGPAAPAGTVAGPEPAARPAEAEAALPATLCVPAREGSLSGRLQGAIEADIDWNAAGEPQCLGGLRPEGDGLRLVYRGRAPDGGALLIVVGAGPLRVGESARNVPVNLTIVREGTGEFYATRGDDKCALDEVRQAPAAPQAGTWRLEARGYCTQPARALADDRAVLLSRFDLTALVKADPLPADGAGAGAR